MAIDIIHADNMKILPSLPDGYFRCIYADPPFGTGKTQKRAGISYNDSFDDFEAFLKPRIEQALRLLTKDGSFFLHLDYRNVHYAKVWCDQIFGRDNFLNEIIWCYDYGARSKSKWPTKHDTILVYVKDPENYVFNYDQMDRIPYLAPGLVGPEKAARGKTPTDWWPLTIVHTTGKEKTGYPTQKPLSLLNRIVKIHSNPGDYLLDPFAGSGSFGESANNLGRNCVLIDDNADAIRVMQKRLGRGL